MNRTTFTLAEAAQLLNCHPETLRRAIREGSLQAARLGKGYRLSRSDLQAFWIAQGGGLLFELSGDDIANTGQETVRGAVPKKAEKTPRTDHQQLSLIAP